jgi:peptide deformylase
MSVRAIHTFPDPVLKKKSKEVAQIDKDILKLLDDMAETMYGANGVGLAAPQVGENLRLIVVDADRENRGRHIYKLINPRIVHSEGTIESEEGCLSVPDLVIKVERAEKVSVEAILPDGSPTCIQAEDLFSIALQHEIDHLDGTLLTDRLSSLKRNLYREKRLREEERPLASS